MRDAIVIGGGQSGLAAARALRARGLEPLVLEAGPEPVGSWPRYYDSLAAFSPVAHSAMPGLRFEGDPDHYPHRDEVVDYLRRYATTLDVDIQCHTRVTAVEQRGGFVVHTAGGEALTTAGVVAASGSFGNPHVPDLTGQDAFLGRQLHAADYRSPSMYAGGRVLVVGAGNSAVQIAYELATVATVTLATHQPITFFPQILQGRDVHHWLTTSGFDQLPPAWLARISATRFVVDTGDYQDALDSGLMDRRPMFTRLDGDTVVWTDGEREHVDAVIYATGYRPDLPYLDQLGALDEGAPKHAGGHLHHPPRTRIRGPRVPTLLRLQHPARRAPRRRAHRRTTRRVRSRRPHSGRPVTQFAYAARTSFSAYSPGSPTAATSRATLSAS